MDGFRSKGNFLTTDWLKRLVNRLTDWKRHPSPPPVGKSFLFLLHFIFVNSFCGKTKTRRVGKKGSALEENPENVLISKRSAVFNQMTTDRFTFQAKVCL